MTAARPERRGVTPDAVDTAERLWSDPSLEGYRIEALSGRVVLSPLRDGDHAVALTELMSRIARWGLAERNLEVVQNVGLALPSGPGEYAMPDLAVVDEDFRDHQLPRGTHAAKAFHLVVEITSSNWRDDLRVKPDAYASAGVPIYLIGDREHQEAKVLWRPEGGEYRSVATYLPGETLTLPGELPVEIDVDTLLQR